MEKNVTPVRTRMEKSMHLDVYRDPWIDAKFLDGHEEKVSLRDCLEKATLIQSLEIKDARFELDNVAPYTLLTLILGRIYKPDSNDKQDMLSRGSFDLAKIDTYITSCEENDVSFDVFDENRPFLQDPVTRDGSKVESVGMLDPMMVSGNNAVFYGSSRFDGLGDWKTAEDILCMTPSQFIASVTRNHMYSNASGQAGATGYATAQAPLHRFYKEATTLKGRCFLIKSVKQWEPMKNRRNRIAFDIHNVEQLHWYWLMNKARASTAYFAFVYGCGLPHYYNASSTLGVRPVFKIKNR